MTDTAQRWLGAHPGGSRAIARGVGLLLMAVAVFTVLEGWRQASR